MRFRLYRPEDFAQLYAIEEACFEAGLRFDRRFMKHLVGLRNGATWIAEANGVMAGFAIVEWTRQRAGLIAYLQTIEVAPSQRGQGAGRELLMHCEDSAVAAAARAIWLHVDEENDAAIRLYEKRGYSRRGRREDYYPEGRAALIYAKQLMPG